MLALERAYTDNKNPSRRTQRHFPLSQLLCKAVREWNAGALFKESIRRCIGVYCESASSSPGPRPVKPVLETNIPARATRITSSCCCESDRCSRQKCPGAKLAQTYDNSPPVGEDETNATPDTLGSVISCAPVPPTNRAWANGRPQGLRLLCGF